MFMNSENTFIPKARLPSMAQVILEPPGALGRGLNGLLPVGFSDGDGAAQLITPIHERLPFGAPPSRVWSQNIQLLLQLIEARVSAAQLA